MTNTVFPEDTVVTFFKNTPYFRPHYVMQSHIVLSKFPQRVKIKDRSPVKRRKREARPDAHVGADIHNWATPKFTFSSGVSVKPCKITVIYTAERKTAV
jgi:hypothetical protein